ncbi:hypothetical protein LCGC14_1723230 [marine sediment metagenome]|uniref:Uncharacterized protein n=1 Tax=marine sediment metagenome TaxID=412755 RepID=A0A0F9HBI9_9ZZZZ
MLYREIKRINEVLLDNILSLKEQDNVIIKLMDRITELERMVAIIDRRTDK